MRARTSLRGRLAAVALGASGVAALGWALRPDPAPAPAAAPAVAAAPARQEPAPVPVSVPAAAPSAAPAAASAPPPAAPAAVGEEALMERLRAEVDARPEVAVSLADEGEAAFPAGTRADERSYLKMRALVHLGDIGQARAVAGAFFERHPDSPLGRSVYRLTGMRPRPQLGPPS